MKTTLVALLVLLGSTAHARSWYCASITGTKVLDGKAVVDTYGGCTRTQSACFDGFILEKSDERYMSVPQVVGPVCEPQAVAYGYSMRMVGRRVDLVFPTLAMCQARASHAWKNFVVVRQCAEVR